MAVKALNFKLDEEEIMDIKSVSLVFNMTMTEVIRQGVQEYVDKLKQDPFYKLTANIQDASPEETDEVLSAIDNLSDDDLTINSVKTISL